MDDPVRRGKQKSALWMLELLIDYATKADLWELADELLETQHSMHKHWKIESHEYRCRGYVPHREKTETPDAMECETGTCTLNPGGQLPCA